MRVLRGHWQLMVLGVVVAALWVTPVLVPLKILVVFLHEFSHALAAWLTGGAVEGMTLSPMQGGTTTTRGGNLFLIISAGYLGSLLLGVVLFLLALRSDLDRWVMGVLGGVLVAIAVAYMREPFALIFCLGAGVVMLGIAHFLPHEVSDLALRLIGLTSMLYAPLDILDDTLRRTHVESDAVMLAREFGGTSQFWGGLWLVISLIVVALCLRFGAGRDSNLHLPMFRRKPRPSGRPHARDRRPR